MCAGLALGYFDQLLTFGPRARVIYSRLFKYTQQHTADFTENNWVPQQINLKSANKNAAVKIVKIWPVTCRQKISSEYKKVAERLEFIVSDYIEGYRI
jgi:hypothetical protein